MKIKVTRNKGTTFASIRVGEVFKFGTDFFIKTYYDKTGQGRAVNLEDGSLVNVSESWYIEKIHNATLNIEV